MNRIKKMFEHFGTVLLVSAVIGAVLGIVMGEGAEVLAPLGTIFTRLLKMLVPMIVFFSISSSFANIGDVRKLSAWATKIIGFFLLTTAIGCFLGIAVGLIFKPGAGLVVPNATYEVTKITAGMFIDWLPENFIGCIAQGNTIQIVFLAIFVGIAAIFIPDGDSKDFILKMLNAGNSLILQIVQGVMYYAPVGICCLMASSIPSLQGSFAAEMSKFTLAYTIAFVLQIVICYFVILKAVGKINPFRFTRKLMPALITAFTTTSSAATLPVNLKCMDEIGVDREISNFGIPLGVTFNMDSMAVEIPLYIMLGMYAVGTAPSIGELILFVVMGIAFSIGCAGVPGGGLAIAVILINAFGLPVQVVAWIAAIFFYLDITGTAMNIWGDAVCTAVVARSEGMFDDAKFNS